MKYTKNNQSGFSLIEVTVVVVIMSVMSLAMGRMVYNQAMQTSYLEDRMSVVSLDASTMANLSFGEGCTNSFRTGPVGAPGSERIITRLRDKDDVNFIQIGDPVLGTHDKLNIASMRLVNVNVPNAPASSGIMRLEVFPQRQRQGGGPSEFAPVTLDLQVNTLAGSADIESCYVIGGPGGADDFDKACVISRTERGTVIPTGAPAYNLSRWQTTTQFYIIKDKESVVSYSAEETDCIPSPVCFDETTITKETYECNNKIATKTGQSEETTFRSRRKFGGGGEGPGG